MHTLERRVVLLDGGHRVIDQLADRRLLGVGLELGPASFLRYPEHVFGDLFIAVFRIGVFDALRFAMSSVVLAMRKSGFAPSRLQAN